MHRTMVPQFIPASAGRLLAHTHFPLLECSVYVHGSITSVDECLLRFAWMHASNEMKRAILSQLLRVLRHPHFMLQPYSAQNPHASSSLNSSKRVHMRCC